MILINLYQFLRFYQKNCFHSQDQTQVFNYISLPNSNNNSLIQILIKGKKIKLFIKVSDRLEKELFKKVNKNISPDDDEKKSFPRGHYDTMVLIFGCSSKLDSTILSMRSHREEQKNKKVKKYRWNAQNKCIAKFFKSQIKMDIQDDSFPEFEVMIQQDHMIRSIVVEGQEIYFPKEDLVVNNSGIARMSNPNSKMDRIKIETKKIKELELLGSGSTAQVRKAVCQINGKQYIFAVKSINAVQPDQRKQLLNDLRQYLRGEYCQYVVEFYTCFFKDGLVKQVIQYMDMGTLKDTIKLIQEGKLSLSEGQIATIIKKILLGLNHIHNVRHSIHRDIKPENILINSKGQIKITDFGVSKCIEHSTGRSVVGSIIYMSPERLSIETQSYSYKSDIWSMGLIMYELATGKKNPYADQGGKVNYFKMSLKVLESPPPELPQNQFSGGMVDFFKRCVNKNEKERASAEMLLGHPWIVQNSMPNLTGVISRIQILH